MAITAAAARELLLYMLSADRQMLRSLREVRPDDLTRDAGTSFRSLLGTIAHILAAQRLWLARFAGSSPDRLSTEEDFPDLMTWIAGWEETAAGIEAFIAGLTDEQLETEITWTTTSGDATYTRPLWQPVLHLVSHSTYHRGQVVSLLRQMGYQPPSTDLIYYFIDRAAQG